MRIRKLGVIAVIASWLAAGSALAAGRSDMPRNVIFILSDDHRYDFMGFHPNAPDWLETPAMDRMAAAGAHLKNAFVTTSLCSPSRASILTGRYAHNHRIVDNTSPIPPGTRFFPQDLFEADYRTAYIGKWHMGEVDDVPQPGFLAPGTEITELVRNIDIAPTLLGLAGLPIPEGMDGRSFLPVLKGVPGSWENELLYEYYWEDAFPHTPTVFAPRTDRFKYIYYHGLWDVNELYDLTSDPREQHNLIRVPAFQDDVRRMRQELWNRMENTGGMQIPLKRPTPWQAAERKLPE